MRYYEFMIEGIEDKVALIGKRMEPRLLAAAQNDPTFDKRKFAEEMTGVDVMNALVGADPTTQGKALQYIANLYVAGEFKFEDLARTKEELTSFFSSVPKLKRAGKSADINTYKTRRDLLMAMQSVSNVDATSGKEQARVAKQEGATLEFSDGTTKIYRLLSEAAACRIGAGTVWCTAGKNNNRFDYYNKQGAIYVIIQGDRKYQFHYESDQFMDETDSRVTQKDIAALSESKAYTDWLNSQIKKHYGKYFEDTPAA